MTILLATVAQITASVDANLIVNLGTPDDGVTVFDMEAVEFHYTFPSGLDLGTEQQRQWHGSIWLDTPSGDLNLSNSGIIVVDSTYTSTDESPI